MKFDECDLICIDERVLIFCLHCLCNTYVRIVRVIN